MLVSPIDPGRIRRPRGPYGIVDLRVVTLGHVEQLGREAALLYLFVCAVGNSDGVSFWSRTRIGRVLDLSQDAVTQGLERLRQARLVLLRDRVVQVLDVPESLGPLPPARAAAVAATAAPPRDGLVPTPPPPLLAPVSEDEIARHEPEARQQLARIHGAAPLRPGIVRVVAEGLALQARSPSSSSVAVRSQKP